MKHVIIGTSGHIDHGKTSLIRALTGNDTDKLKEEKQRGISINLGFTFFDLPSGKRAGIIDVPGHEKFIKNMLAGATSLDIVLIVIASDEGIMPQTKEHIDILQLLGVKKSIVVLTKKDLVDDEWTEMIKGDIREYLKNTEFKNSPIIEFSSKTKEGIQQLVDEIDKAVEDVEVKDREGHFRLAVDRSFSVSGFGTVVTGTILSGAVAIGDEVAINPKGINAKIRNIQIHEKNVEFGEAGQRCALNITGISKGEVGRGDIVCSPDTISPAYMVDIKIKYLDSNEKNLENRQRIKVYHGTSEIIGRVILLDKEELKPGEEGYAQLRLESELCGQKDDKIVLRNYSPMTTIGGGIILDPNSKKAKRFNGNYIESLNMREGSSIENIIENTVLGISEQLPKKEDILKSVGKNIENISEILDKLLKDKKIMKIQVGDDVLYFHNKFFRKKSEEIYKLLNEFHKNNPLKVGMIKEEVRSKMFSNKVKQKVYKEFVSLMENRNVICQGETTMALKEFSIKLTKEQKRIKELILQKYKDGRFQTPKIQDVIVSEKDKKECNVIYSMLIEQGELVKLPEDVVMHKECLKDATNKVVEFLNINKSITLVQTKDILNTSRKYLVAIMEYLDNNKITKRVEDRRVLY